VEVFATVEGFSLVGGVERIEKVNEELIKELMSPNLSQDVLCIVL